MSHREFCYRCNIPILSASVVSAASAVSASHDNHTTAPLLNRRRLTRKKVVITNVAVEGEVTFKHHGTALDITPLGICLRTAFPCRIGAHLNLRLPLDGRVHHLTGTILHRNEGEKDGIPIYTYGIRLDPPLTDTRAAIERI
jgi:hypothetical protein